MNLFVIHINCIVVLGLVLSSWIINICESTNFATLTDWTQCNSVDVEFLYTIDSRFDRETRSEWQNIGYRTFGYSGYGVSVDWSDLDSSFSNVTDWQLYSWYYNSSSTLWYFRMRWFLICGKNEALSVYTYLNNNKDSTFFDWVNDASIAANMTLSKYNNPELTTINVYYNPEGDPQFIDLSDYYNDSILLNSYNIIDYFHIYNDSSNPYIINQYSSVTFSATGNEWWNYASLEYSYISPLDDGLYSLWYCMNCYNPYTNKNNSVISLTYNVLNSNIFSQQTDITGSSTERTVFLTLLNRQTSLCPTPSNSTTTSTTSNNNNNNNSTTTGFFYSDEIFLPGNTYEIRVFASYRLYSFVSQSFYVYINIPPENGTCDVLYPSNINSGVSLNTTFELECYNAYDPDLETTQSFSSSSSNSETDITYNMQANDFLLSDTFVSSSINIETLLSPGVVTIDGIFKDGNDGISCYSFDINVSRFSENVNNVLTKSSQLLEETQDNLDNDNDNVNQNQSVFSNLKAINDAIDDSFLATDDIEYVFHFWVFCFLFSCLAELAKLYRCNEMVYVLSTVVV